MTPNKNGKVTVVKREGLASLYFAIPYVSTISCADRVYEFFSKYVGFLRLLPGTYYEIGMI